VITGALVLLWLVALRVLGRLPRLAARRSIESRKHEI
jgi:hypothetical protein